MDKTSKNVIHAVAGAGKTKYIIDSLNLEESFAIVTYTVNNQNELRDRVIQKFGMIPENIHIFSFWTFLYSFCMTPLLSKKPKGIIFDLSIEKKINVYGQRIRYGINGYVFSNRLSQYLLKNKKDDCIERVDKFFDIIFVDELQDFDSYDLDFLLSLSSSKIEVTFVGDYYQHTFSTSNAGNKSSGVWKSFVNFEKKFTDSGFIFDKNLLKASQRCTQATCKFVSDKIGIEIESSKDEQGSDPYLIEDDDMISTIWSDDKIPKLFYQNHYKYTCNNSINWGESKGLTFQDVCVVLNKTTYKLYMSNSLDKLASPTKSKFYVACTRAKGKIFFVDQAKVKQFKKPN